MKQLLDLYPRITSFSNLWAAAQRAQRGERYRPDVLSFNSRLEAELFRLQCELRAFTYQAGRCRRFQIRDPGPRTISAAPYRDRVVHHALCAGIVPPLEQRFIRTSRFLANVHLEGFDHTIRALPGIEAYLHYVDDFVRTADGASFVGFFVRPGRVRLRNHNLLRGRRRLKRLSYAVATGACSFEEARTPLLCWNAHLAHGPTMRLRRRLFAGVPFAEGLAD